MGQFIQESLISGSISTIIEWVPAWSNLFEIEIKEEPSDDAVVNAENRNLDKLAPTMITAKSIDINGRTLEFEYNAGVTANILKGSSKLDIDLSLTLREREDFSVGRYLNTWYSHFWKDGAYVTGKTGKKKLITISAPTPKVTNRVAVLVYEPMLSLKGCLLTSEPIPKFDWDTSVPIEYTVRMRANSLVWITPGSQEAEPITYTVGSAAGSPH